MSNESPRGSAVDYFVLQMNALAQHLGMLRTLFLNPSGVDAKEKPFSTASDVALLTRYAMNNAGFRFYVSQKEREIEFGRGPGRMRYLLRNTNELLGRNEIDGDRMFVILDRQDGRGRDGARLEAHRRYIDIQYTIAGEEEIGWTPLASCTAPDGPFDETKDIAFFRDAPSAWLRVSPGSFAIFFPEDAHAPLAGRGALVKAIVKIAL